MESGLNPQLQGHCVARVRHLDPPQGVDPVGLETAECVGQMQSKAAVDLLGDDAVHPPTLLRGAAVAGELGQVAAAGYDVGAARGGHQLRDPFRLMLAIAVDRHQHAVSVANRVVERAFQSGAVPAVLAVSDNADILASGKHLGSAVRRSVVDNQHMATIAERLIEDFADVGSFVETGSAVSDFVVMTLF